MQEDVVALKKQLYTNHQSGIALDIDEVLSDTVGYLMLGLSDKFGAPQGKSAKELMAQYRYTYLVPEFVNEAAGKWVHDEIHRDDLQDKLQLIEGSKKYVQFIHKKMPIVAYLTKRPLVVQEGTLRWLKKHAFPNAPVIFKPMEVPVPKGNEWKKDVLEYMYPEVKGIIDDDAFFADMLTSYPGKVWLFGHEKYAGNSSCVIPCKDWKGVYTAMK